MLSFEIVLEPLLSYHLISLDVRGEQGEIL